MQPHVSYCAHKTPVTGPYRRPDQSSPTPPYFLNIHFKIILSPKPMSSKCLFPSSPSTEVVTASLWTGLALLCHQTIRTLRTYIISTAQIPSTLLSSNLRTWRFTSCVTCTAIIPILSQINSVHTVTPHNFFKVNVNILPTMFRSSKCCLPLERFKQNSVHTSHLPHAYYTLRPSHSPTPIPPTAACFSSSVPISHLTKSSRGLKNNYTKILNSRIQNLEIWWTQDRSNGLCFHAA